MAIGVCLSPVDSEQEALTLMLHHLRLAASYFEATPEKIDGDPFDFSYNAQRAFIAAMEALYPDD